MAKYKITKAAWQPSWYVEHFWGLKNVSKLFRLLTPIAQQKTQTYDTSIKCDVSIANLKIWTAFLAAIMISWTFYWGL